MRARVELSSAAETLLEGALDAGVERVQSLQGKRLGGGWALGAGDPRAP